MADKSGVSTEKIKELREKTGVGVMDCKRALEETGGDTEKAVVILRERGLATIKKREEKVAEQGVVESYLHIGQQIGSLAEINCETDFVARNADFLELAHHVVLQVAACNPKYVGREQVPAEEVDEEKEKYRQLCIAENKPEKVWDSIIEGMLEKYFQEVCLLEQPFVKDPSMTVGELVAESAAKLGEKIEIRRFCRYQVGENT